ncbi:hypothetical protein [Acrocarpospora catenulata]|uniref:hypothetical protein n=1 Tax=Acrocarpospora catenulata TaxID=2836182 RepID=UPI001BDAE681|nr:hypothetical protein [Acrocarpospora catenulata]
MPRSIRALASIATAAAVFASVVATSQPAQASFHGLWNADNSWYQGDSRIFTTSKDALPSYYSDKISSIRNLDSVAWVLFDDKYYQDRRFCIRPGESVPDLGAPMWKFNDKTSSVMRLNTASCSGYVPFYY